MNHQEKEAVQTLNTDLVRDLDLRHIVPFLYQRKILTRDQARELCEQNGFSRNNCQKFLLDIVDICPFQEFLNALRYEHGYDFLAQKLEETLELQRISDGGQPSFEPRDVRAAPTHPTEPFQRPEVMTQAISRINMFTWHRRGLVALSQKLKSLTHDGNMVEFRKVSDAITTKFNQFKLRTKGRVKDNMRLADMRMVVLDAEASAQRVKMDVDASMVDGRDVFEDMSSLIPYTTNPVVSSMTYLARYGSSFGMLGLRDIGLEHVQYAKQHAQNVQPCKETGLVYYIEVNHLIQKYEDSPDNLLKSEILKTASEAMSHFGSEDDNVKLDYERMLMLKIVFCRLGIGVFCRKIPGTDISREDVVSTKACLDFVERPDVWKGMEKRRKMFYLVAKSELFRHQGQLDLALLHARQARDLAEGNKWKTELCNIQDMIDELDVDKQRFESEAVGHGAGNIDLVNELFEELDIDEIEVEST